MVSNQNIAHRQAIEINTNFLLRYSKLDYSAIVVIYLLTINSKITEKKEIQLMHNNNFLSTSNVIVIIDML